jgi:hypothetical protein
LYACIAATQKGARCRNFVSKAVDICWRHQKEKDEGKEVKLAPSPNTILVKFNINPSWTQQFEKAGVPRKRPFEVELEEKHIAQARKLDRRAYEYRDIADSGVPVFGPQGSSEVSILGLLEELQREGYQPQGVHIRTRAQKKFDVLVIPFVRGSESNSTLPKRALELLQEFLRLSCWGFVHVWANPPDGQGKVVHTINLGHREPEKSPQWTLCFNHGLWNLTS